MHTVSDGGSREAADAPAASVEALRAELARERARVREIDHRARNSLQLASSLILLLGRSCTHEETRRTLKSLHHKIAALGMVHRGFLETAEPGRFDLTGCLREQAEALAHGAASSAELKLDLEPVQVAASAAAPLILIATELASNALAHAAVGGRPARVRLTLRRRGEHGCMLAVEDDGPGLPAGAESAGFGLTMVRLLAQQLNARLAFESSQPGLRAVVTTA